MSCNCEVGGLLRLLFPFGFQVRLALTSVSFWDEGIRRISISAVAASHDGTGQ
jgi:hypothetical protein